MVNSSVSDRLSMDEDEIEVLKESCLNDLFYDSSKNDDWSSPSCQIQISSVFSLASQDSPPPPPPPPPLDTNFNLQYQHNHHISKQFDSDAILNNLPDNPSSVSSTTTEAVKEVAGEGEATKEREATSESIKNDDGTALENVSDEAGKTSSPAVISPDNLEGEGSQKTSSDQSGVEETKTSDLISSDDLPLPEWEEVSSTTSDPAPPPPPAPPVFKTDLSQFFSGKSRAPVASQAGQNVIPVTGRDEEEDSELLTNTERKVLVKIPIPRELRTPRGSSGPVVGVTPPPPTVDLAPSVKRKRGRPKGSKNKKKPTPSFSLPPRCKRCLFLRKTRR